MGSLRDFQAETGVLCREIYEVNKVDWTPFMMVTGLSEEVGEVADLILMKEGVKTRKRGTGDDNLVDELCDVLYMLMMLAENYEVDFEKGYRLTLDKVRLRHLTS